MTKGSCDEYISHDTNSEEGQNSGNSSNGNSSSNSGSDG